jgi:hypothetical protein
MINKNNKFQNKIIKEKMIKICLNISYEIKKIIKEVFTP